MEGMTPLAVAAASLHEFYVTLQDQGFEKDEALHIVTATLTSGKASDGNS
jgi:hypothetical protein